MNKAGPIYPIEMGSDQSTALRRFGAPCDSAIYLLDDDSSLLRALGRRLRAAGFEVKTFESAHDFLAYPRSERSECAVLDLQMPELSGLEVQELLADANDSLPIVFLTAHGDIPSSVRAMKGGAVDFLTKPVLGSELVEAVNRALQLQKSKRESRSMEYLWRERYSSLTPSERRVFAFVVEGLPNKGIAAEIGVSERTVKAHRAEVMRKMCVQSPAELGRSVEWIGDHFESASSGRR